MTSTLSRKLQTATLPTPPVPVGYCWWNSRFHCLYALIWIKAKTDIQATFTSHQDNSPKIYGSVSNSYTDSSPYRTANVIFAHSYSSARSTTSEWRLSDG